MKLKIFLTLSIFVFAFISAFSQESFNSNDEEEEIKEAPRYKITANYPLLIVHKYILDLNSEVERTYSDSTKLKYTRDIRYFISFYAPEKPNDGIQSIRVSLDSMIYKFDGAGKSIDYFTQDEEAGPPFSHSDYERSSVPLGIQYEITYSPYNEVIKVSGDKLERKINYLTDEKTGIRDSIRRAYWTRGLDQFHLSFIGNIHKSILPDYSVGIDSTWKKTADVELEHVRYRDSVEFKLKDFTVQNYIIEGKTFDIAHEQDPTLIYDIPKFVEITETEGEGNYKFKISPRGIVNEAQIEYDVKLKGNIVRDEFIQTIKQKMTWQLQTMLKY